MDNRGNGTDNWTSHNLQQILIYYLTWYCRQHFQKYTVGRRIVRSKRFDDVFLDLYHQQRRWIYMFDMKSRRYKSYDSLFGTSSVSGEDFYIRHYFKEYLRLKDDWSTTLTELIVWIHTGFKKADFVLEPYEWDGDQPIFLDAVEIGVERYRIKNYASLGQKLLRHVNPLYELANRLSCLLFEKNLIGPDTIPQNFYDVLLRDVFEDNRFRKDFLEAKSELPAEVQEFRNYLEKVLEQKFLHRNLRDFRLNKIDEEPFSAHLKLRLEPPTRIAPERASWTSDFRATMNDIDRFFSLLVFYTHAPTVTRFRNLLQTKVDIETQSELSLFCVKGRQLTDLTVDRFFRWMELRKRYSYELNDNIQFEAVSLEGLESTLSGFGREKNTATLTVVASASVLVTVERIVRTLHRLKLRNYLVLNDRQFATYFDELLTLMPGLMESKPFIVLIDKDLTISSCKLKLIVDMGCSTISVIPRNAANSVNVFSDFFNFTNLTGAIKSRLLSKKILIQERIIALNTILDESYFSELSAEAFLDWNSNDRESIGSNQLISLPKGYIERTVYNDKSSFKTVSDIDFAAVNILIGETGIGKSVTLSKLALHFQEQFRDHLIIHHDSKTIVHLFSSETSEDHLNTLIKLIDAKQLNQFQTFVLRKMMLQKRLILLLDGFDEISHQKESSAEAMVEWCRTAPFKLIVLASRPHRLSLLKEYFLEAMVLQLKPLTEQKQSSLLHPNCTDSLSSGDEIAQVCRLLFDGCNVDNLLGIPLQAEIIASIYKEFVISRKSHTIADVMQAFVDKKFAGYANKFYDLSCKAHEVVLTILRTTFENDHAELAFRIEMEQSLDYNKCVELDQYGLLRIDTVGIAFIHPLLQKYFFCQYILTHYVEQDIFNNILNAYFSTPTDHRFDQFLDHHIGRTNTNPKPVGIPQKLKTSDFNRKRKSHLSYKLHPEKLEQFYLFFKPRPSELICRYLRTTIDKGQFNTFEAIYDCLLCSSSEQTVQFDFNPNCKHPSIDLSTVSEDQLVQLLNVLQKKHDNDFVQKIFGRYSPEEADFVSIAIEKDYHQLTVHLFRIEQDLVEEDESDRIQEYIEGRWLRYLRLVIEHRRDLLLETVLGCIEKRWHPRVTKYFLMTKNVLAALIMACEKVDGSSLETIRKVVDFLREHLSTSDLTVLARRKYNCTNSFERVEKVENKDIRNLFEELLSCNAV
ncbi:uncharacterized protein LOC131430121 [Malaya genurostris]|uniref:uncharacterized protein LOC131430121 n=1 Tax=Malaya genurostris TaxID=325434 RepID=UPI0026F3F51E|nr:uncharacterized protein LOC131430121 [Malaya genurostris]